MECHNPSHFKTFSNLFIVAVHYKHHYMICAVANAYCIHGVHTSWQLENNQYITTISCCYC